MQNVRMMSMSNQQIKILAGTKIGEATPMDHPMAPEVMCDWIQPEAHEEMEDKEQHLQHIYMMKDNPKVKKRVAKLWKELDLDNPNKNLSKEGRRGLHWILTKCTVFTDKEVKARCTDWLEMEIRVKPDAQPVCAQVRPLSNAQKNNLKEQLDSWLRDRIITRAESPWGSPLMLVAKKDSET